jgi:hypothetical protein
MEILLGILIIKSLELDYIEMRNRYNIGVVNNLEYMHSNCINYFNHSVDYRIRYRWINYNIFGIQIYRHEK